MRFRAPDDSVEWEEARVLQDGREYPARILSNHWVTKRAIAGDTMTIRLESEFGISEIEGDIACSIFRGISMAPAAPGMRARGPLDRTFGFEPGDGPALVIQQSAAHYEMNGMTAYGVCERHNFADRFED